MAGIRLHVVAPLVLVAVNKCARDQSVYVRKCAANALPKLFDLRIEENTSAIEEVVGILLNDNSPGVVGAAAAAFASVCPNNFPLIGKSYKRLCEILPDVEEWGQILLISILLRYIVARHGLVRESIMSFLIKKESSNRDDEDVFTSNIEGEENTDQNDVYESELANTICRSYIEGPDEYLSRASYINMDSLKLTSARYTSGKINNDIKILLQCTSPLLWSYNSAVVVAAATVHWIMAPMEDVKRIVKPLLFVMRSSNASRYVVLCNIQVFAKAMPSLFATNFEDFYVVSSDTSQIKALKLDILASIATESSIPFILKEFQDYIRDPDRRFAADTVGAIGLCAQRLPKMADACLDGLLSLTRHEFFSGELGSLDEEAGVLTQIIMSIWSIINRDPISHEKVVVQLIRSLDSIKVPAARAIVIWMVGEYNSIGEKIPKMLTSVLGYLAYCFKSEALEGKLQILNTNFKVVLGATGKDKLIFRKTLAFVLDLAECDANYDIRDRARFLKKLSECNIGSCLSETQADSLPQNKNLHCVLAEHIFGGKLKSISPEPLNSRFYLPGSLSQIVFHAAPGYEPLPKPGSLLQDDPDQISSAKGKNMPEYGVADSGPTGMDDFDASDGSSDEGSTSNYSSQLSMTGSGSDVYNSEIGSASEADNNTGPLIQISEIGNENLAPQTGNDYMGDLISKTALESWLDQQPGSSNTSISHSNRVRRSSARISFGNIGQQVKHKIYTLLDPANGNGLKVEYSFSSEVSRVSPLLVCIEVSFKNCSAESMTAVNLVEEESSNGRDSADQIVSAPESDVPTLVPMEEINSLEPGETIKRIMQVRFHHHLLPLKLALLYNGKKVPVKLRPDIGYFVKPLPLDLEAFTDKESHLRGMFEYMRGCSFNDHVEELNKDRDGDIVKDKFLLICESLALKMLSNANLSLVSVDMPIDTKLDDATGLRLRFSCEILSKSIPCLITVTVEGKCSEPLNLVVKVNCEETVFGLNLLNRVVNFLSESLHHHP
ncbi:AP3-complex subunit beta-A isoform X2 [Rhodamnia argentea]|nr:AP3-complex subunit beta-A isoform X2 [Rhodamnia argentea]